MPAEVSQLASCLYIFGMANETCRLHRRATTYNTLHPQDRLTLMITILHHINFSSSVQRATGQINCLINVSVICVSGLVGAT